jgi:hypothetical protein
MLPLLIVELNRSRAGRRVIQTVVDDVLYDLPVTAQLYLDRPERAERVVGVLTEAAYAGLDTRPIIASVFDGNFEEVTAQAPMLLDDRDLADLADVVRRPLVSTLCLSMEVHR